MFQSNGNVSVYVKIQIWFYRIFFITFGGVAIDPNKKLYINKYWKYYGYLSAILFTIFNIYTYFITSNSPAVRSMYDKRSATPFYMINLMLFTQSFHISANIWYLNLNGIKFVEVFYRSDVKEYTRNGILLLIWICHILFPIIWVPYQVYATNLIQPSSYLLAFVSFINRIHGFIALWAIPYLTWIISTYFFKILKNIEWAINQELDRNSG